MTTLEILKAARGRIAKPEMWYQGAYSTTGDKGILGGKPVCAWAALTWAYGQKHPTFRTVTGAVVPVHPGIPPICAAALKLMEEYRADKESKHWTLHGYNDAPGRTHAEVLALLDAAIAKLEPRQLHPLIQDALREREVVP